MSRKKNREGVSVRIRYLVLRRDKHTCQYCGAKAPDAQLHIDHQLAVAEGGTNDIDNLITACVRCNLGKSDLSADGGADVRPLTAKEKALERRLDSEIHFAERRNSWSWWASFTSGGDIPSRAVLHAVCRESDASGQFRTSVSWLVRTTLVPEPDVRAYLRGMEAIGMISPVTDDGLVVDSLEEPDTMMGDLKVDFGFQRGGPTCPPYTLDRYGVDAFSRVESIYG